MCLDLRAVQAASARVRGPCCRLAIVVLAWGVVKRRTERSSFGRFRRHSHVHPPLFDRGFRIQRRWCPRNAAWLLAPRNQVGRRRCRFLRRGWRRDRWRDYRGCEGGRDRRWGNFRRGARIDPTWFPLNEDERVWFAESQEAVVVLRAGIHDQNRRWFRQPSREILLRNRLAINTANCKCRKVNDATVSFGQGPHLGLRYGVAFRGFEFAHCRHGACDDTTKLDLVLAFVNCNHEFRRSALWLRPRGRWSDGSLFRRRWLPLCAGACCYRERKSHS
jgi:hypothetical protein